MADIVTGIEEIDDQHIEILNSCIELNLIVMDPYKKFMDRLISLGEIIKFHFNTEESFFNDMDDYDSSYHREDHEVILKEFSVNLKVLRDTKNDREIFIQYLMNVVNFHIEKYDIPFSVAYKKESLSFKYPSWKKSFRTII
jgi:hemerythrin-like metal-binding protein